MSAESERGNRPPSADAWNALVDGLRAAGEHLAGLLGGLDPTEQADGFRSLVRALNNQLSRFEVDREQPELVPFNGWREKFFMDNPDFRYWVADIRDDRRYRIVGSTGDAVYQSVTVYAASGTTQAAATSRIDSDQLRTDADGKFELIVAPEPPAQGSWLQLPPGATALWVRQFHADASRDRLGWCRIEAIDPPIAAPTIDPERFHKHLRRVGSVLTMVPRVFENAVAADLAAPNQVRHWSEMTGGAAFTEPDIHYLRGAWQLDDGEALVIEGPLVQCRYWNVLLYSRFLNSLDYRHRIVSRTAATSRVRDGRYRFVLAARRLPATGSTRRAAASGCSSCGSCNRRRRPSCPPFSASDSPTWRRARDRLAPSRTQRRGLGNVCSRRNRPRRAAGSVLARPRYDCRAGDKGWLSA